MTGHGDGPSSSSGTLPSQTSEQLSEITRKCLAKIEAYKSGLRLPLAKAQCVTEIAKILIESTVTPPLSVSEINASLLSYTDIIDNADESLQRAEQSGVRAENREEDDHESIRLPPRNRSGTPDEGRTTKRQRVDSDEYPWVRREGLSATPLNPSLTATLALLKLFAQDPKLAKASILTSPRAPQFPHSEWSNILAGSMVNLDHVLSGMHAVSSDNREVELIGGIQLKYGAAEAAKKVRNSGDWSQAFRVYTKAVSFVFPHRKEELEDYSEQVAALFAVVTEANHAIIINYDKAVRTRVGDVRNLLLTDRSEFEDLRLYWLHPLGQGFRDTSAGVGHNRSPKSSFRSDDDCLRFNNGKCPNKASSCKYRHRCSGCGGKHMRGDCDKGGATG